ncbi:helix-turn-helix domain-containing protein [Enterovibrio norvegicus]|uniref:helix-turn-helix domain-containing protein n=1 Tax=Enterovibrio norvegicus TaxID=188144 RepID=UPI001F535953|nr:AraC family transcriptional regulator [Enterovibrio norvegicus]
MNTILSVIALIEDSLPETLRVEQIATRSGYSRWHLQRQFKRATGMSISQYQRHRLLSLAAEKIATTEHRILDIAIEFGFESQEAFARAFKRFAMVAPKNIRQQPVWAKRLSLTKMDKTALERLSLLNQSDIRFDTQPASRWACSAIRIDSIDRDATVIDERIEAGFIHLRQQVSLDANQGALDFTRCRILEFSEHNQYASGSFPLAIGFQVDDDFVIPDTLFEAIVPERHIGSIEVPSTEYIEAVYFHLGIRLKEEHHLRFGPLPYCWGTNDAGLTFSFAVEPFDASKQTLTHVDTFPVSVISPNLIDIPVSRHSLPKEKHAGTRRIASVFDAFPSWTHLIANNDEGMMVFGDPSAHYDAQFDVFFAGLEKSLQQAELPPDYHSMSIEGCYLASTWKGKNLSDIDSDIERFYHYLNRHSEFYYSAGPEIIRDVKVVNTGDVHSVSFELLTPIRSRQR